MRRDLLLLGVILLLLSVVVVSYSSQTAVTVYRVDGNSLTPLSVRLIDRGQQYDVHQNPPYDYSYSTSFRVNQLGRRIWYVANYAGEKCNGNLYIYYVLGHRVMTRPAKTGDLGYDRLDESMTGGYSINNNCNWSYQYVGHWSVPFLLVSNGFTSQLGYVKVRYLPSDPQNGQQVWDECVSLDVPGDSPAVCGKFKYASDIVFSGWFYDFTDHKYGLGVYVYSNSLDGSLRQGFYVSKGTGPLISVDNIHYGPCGIAVQYVGGSYYLVEHVDDNGEVQLSPFSVTPNGVFFYDGNLNRWVCLLSDGRELYPTSSGWTYVRRFSSVQMPNGSFFYGAAIFPCGEKNCLYIRSAYSDYYGFVDDDGDGVPDVYVLSGYNNHRYEVDPVQSVRLHWLDPPAVPRETNAADLNFRLDIGLWPGASVQVQDFHLSVDGNELNGTYDFVYTYHFTYGSHQICYSFSVKNGDDTDSYSGCFNVHIGYFPWNVGFSYEQNGDSVTLIGHATDDGRIVSYSWAVDGNAVGSNLPVVTLNLSPGDHDVCLTVTDNDGLKVKSCGTIAVSVKEVPSGVVREVETKEITVPVVNEVPVSSSSLSVVPIRMVVSGLGILFILLSLLLG